MQLKRSNLLSAVWRKSTRSSANSCVEVAYVGDGIAVRDSKNRSGPVLIFTPVEWEAFVGGMRSGEFRLHDAESA